MGVNLVFLDDAMNRDAPKCSSQMLKPYPHEFTFLTFCTTCSARPPQKLAQASPAKPQ